MLKCPKCWSTANNNKAIQITCWQCKTTVRNTLWEKILGKMYNWEWYEYQILGYRQFVWDKDFKTKI